MCARHVVLAAVADVAAVLIFAASGRRTHDEGGQLLGLLTTAGPFTGRLPLSFVVVVVVVLGVLLLGWRGIASLAGHRCGW